MFTAIKPLQLNRVYSKMQLNFGGLNTDGLFTKAISNLFLSLYQKNPTAADIIVFGIISMVFILIRYVVCTH